MKRNVLVLAFIVAFFGIGLITPITNNDTISIQLDNLPKLEYTPSAPGDNTEDYVDSVSNLHLPTDFGTHDVFADLQDFGSNYDAMTEEYTGTPDINEYRYVDGVTTPTWTTVGTTPYLNTQDQPTNYIYAAANGLVSDWYTFADTSGTGSGFTVNMSIYWTNDVSGDSYPDWELDWTGDGVADSSGSFTTQTAWGWSSTGTITGLDTQTEINAARIRFTHNKGGAGPDQVSIDAARIGIYQTGAPNYELDLEVGWTAADFDETNEELCIYPITGGGWPTEDIKVDIWTGAWTNVFADLTPDQWNNVSIGSYVTDATVEIRFFGGTETGDTTQDTWEIDAVLIHTWTPSYTPANDQAPTFDNPSDIDNMYAQYQEYQITVYVSDQNTFTDIDYLEIGLWDDTQTTEYCRFRYDEDTNTFTEEYDIGTAVSLNTGSSTATESGNDIDATFYFTVDWDFPDSTDLDARCYVIDAQTESATTWYEVNWDVETRLEYSVAPSIDDASGTADRGDLDGSFSLTGTVIYYNSGDDSPASTAVDVWVSASEYGANVGPWSDPTLTAGAFDVTCYADDVVGQDTYTVKVVEEGTGAGGTDLYYTTSVTDMYIADRVQVQLYSVVDGRVNIGTSVNIDFTIYYDYDNSPVADGTVTLNTIPATDQGSGVWRITESEAAVTANTYNTVAYSGGTHGISVVDQNGLSQQVIWDQIVVQTTVADDAYVNVGDNVEIRVTLWLAYDSTFLGSGDSVTLDGQAMTWDAGNSWFDLSVSQASVGLWSYFVNSSSDTTYGITNLDTNSQSVDVVWDQIVVQTTVADDAHVNVGDNVEIRVTLWLAYDSSFLGSGDSVTLDGQAMTWDAGNSWFDLTVSQASVGLWTYFVNSSTETNFGITAIDTNSQSVDVVWDEIVVQTTVADDTRVNVGANVEIRVTLWLAYDNTFLGSGDTVTLDGEAMTWDAGNSWFDLTVSQASVGLWTYFVNSSTETGFGISVLDTNSQNVDVIWDQIVVQSTVADDSRVNVGDNVEIRVTLWLAYDNTFLVSGDTVTLDGQAMTWDAGNSWFDLTVSQASVGLWSYFVNSSTETGFGITALDTNSQTVDVIWDRIVVQTTVADDSRVNVGANVEIRVTLWLAYDSTLLGSGDTVTLDGQAMTWDAGNSWFDLTVTQASIGLWKYFVNSSTETGFGITTLDTNSQSVDVIWDEIVVQTTVVDDSRINVGTNAEIRVTLWLAYDSTFLGNGDTVTLAGQAMTWDAGNSWFDLAVSQASVGLWNYFVNSSSDATYGITLLDTNSQSVDVIWDQIVVQTTVADDTRVNVGDNVEIRVTLWLAYDSTFLGSGDTVTLAGLAMTWDAGSSWFDLSVSQASVGLWTYFVNSSSDATYGITLLDVNSQSVDVVWDQIIVQTTVADDTRLNVGANAEIRVTLWLAYDSSFLGSGDSVTLDGQAMTWDAGNSWFDLTVSQASVGLWTYFVNSTSETGFGITSFNLNSQNVAVIWDQIVVQTTVVNDNRVGIGTNAEVRVTLWLAYDSTFLGSGDTVTLAGQAMTWDAGNSWFDLAVSQASVGLWAYFVNSSSDATYGITLLDTNGQSVDIIWDQVAVRGYSVLDDRVNVGTFVDVNVTVEYEYDDTPVTDGSIIVNGEWATHIESGIWIFTVNQSVVGQQVYHTVISSGNAHGIIAVDDTPTQSVTWDRIQIRTTTTDNDRINYGSQATIAVTARLEFDLHSLGSGDSLYLNNTLMSWNGTHFTLNPQFFQVGIWTFFVNSTGANEATYGISAVFLDNNQVDQIWDRIQILTTVATDGRVDSGTGTTTINVTAQLEYDSHALTSSDTLYLNGALMTWDTDHFYTIVGPYLVGSLNFYVNSTSANEVTYGITEVYLDGNNADVIWDQLVITIGVDDSTPYNAVQVNFTLSVIFDYDDVACTTYQIVILRNGSWWHSFTDANKSLFVDTNSDTAYTYTVSVITSESTYNILAFSTNSQQVVWSPSPNNAPVNDASPTLTNPDDASYIYARYKYYIITSNVSDIDGYADIVYVELTLYDDSRSTPVWTVRYTVSGGTFSVELGVGLVAIHLSSSAVGSDNDLDITWVIKIDWDHTDLTDVDTRQYVYDGEIGVEDFYESDWDVETRLEITGFTVDDGSGTADRGPLDGAFTVSGTVIFLGSVDNYPLSNETDVWVSSSEYGTSVGPWSNLTLTSGQFSLTAYADDAVGQDTLTVKAVQEAAGSGGTDLLSSSTQTTYIADRIQVQVYSSPDPRVNIGDTATIDVELAYAYDLTSVINGTVTINGFAATHQGSGIWRITDTKASVQLVTYDNVAYSGGIHGLNQVDQSAMSQDVIWDLIVVQTTVADDTRVNIGANVEIRVTLWLAYDSSFLGSGDTVSLNGVAMTWDFGDSRFELTVSQASVGLWTYFVNSSSETTHGITNLDLNSQSVEVVWDQIVVQTTVVDNNRLNVNANAEVRVTLWLDYDDTYLGAGDTVTLDGSAMTWDAANTWFDLTVSQSSVGAWVYFVNSTADSTYGITNLDLNSQQVQVIWDEIVVLTTVADDTHVNMGANVEIRVTLMLSYDSTFLGGTDSVTLDGTAMTWDGVNTWFDLTVSQASVGLWSYYVNSSADATYGITALNLNSQSVDVIWDRIVVQTTVVDDDRVDVDSNAEIRVTLQLEYDGAFLGAADSVTLDGTAMTWDAVNTWFDLTVSQSSVGLWTYFVNSSTDTAYGVDLLDLNGNSVSVIWDRVQVQSYSVVDDRVNIGDTVDIDVSLFYDYDDSAVTDGTVTVNGISATYQSGSIWRFSDSEVSVVMNTYNLVASSGNAHGLSVVDQNLQTQDVIWDRLVVVIGVDDATPENGHQANFTLTVTYEYDSAACTTYRIVIDRNGTWWHSFTDANQSLFVDTNTDMTYLYNASFVSSESTYGITEFTTNTLQVVWSMAPNELPVNDSSPVLTNGDDTDYLYARYRFYIITTSVSDPDGYNDISYVELTLFSDDRSTPYWTIRYTFGTDTFSVESGGSIVVDNALSSSAGAGNTLTITWFIKVGWDHADIVDTDIQQFVTDGSDTDSDFYETDWNVETRLDYSTTPALSDERGDVNTANLVGTGSVIYYGSSHSPLSNETDVWILHDVAGTWSGDLTAGSFSVTSIGSAVTVRLNTYTFKIVAEGVGSGGSDLYYTTSPTDTFITDRIEIYTAGVVDDRIDINSDCEVWWRARYDFDGGEIQSGLTLELNGSRTLVWNATNSFWVWQETSTSPASAGFYVTSASESGFGLTVWFNTTPVQQVIWDALIISMTDPVDQRIDVGTNASGIVVSAVYAYDGAVYDGSFTLNNTNFQYATPQKQGYTVATASGDFYDITTIETNDVTFCIWDRVLVVSIDADDLYHDPSEDVVITVELQYEYDGTPVLAGTFSIVSYPLTHVGSGAWEVQVTIGSYQSLDFDDLTTCDATLHGLSEYNLDSNSVTVYWDRLEFTVNLSADLRVNVGSSVDIEWSVQLENAGIAITSGVTAQITGGVYLVPSGGVYVGTVSQSVVGQYPYGILSASLGEIDQFIEVSPVVTWDEVLVTSIIATQLSVDRGTATEIRVTLEYKADSTDVTTGVVNLDDNGAIVPMSYNAAGYWSATVTKTTAGNYSFTVASLSGNTHGITALDTDGLSVEVEWVGAPGFVLDTMTLMIIGGGVGIGVLALAIVASRRRRGGVAADLVPIEPEDFGVAEPVEPEAPVEAEVVEPEAEAIPEEIEPTEPEVVEEPEIEPEVVDEVAEPEEVELPPMDEDLVEPEVEEVSIEPEVEVVEEVTEPKLEVEPEVVDYDDIPEEFIEPAVPVDLTTLTKKELLDLIPDDIRETTPAKELKRLTKQELISLIESFRD